MKCEARRAFGYRLEGLSMSTLLAVTIEFQESALIPFWFVGISIIIGSVIIGRAIVQGCSLLRDRPR